MHVRKVPNRKKMRAGLRRICWGMLAKSAKSGIAVWYRVDDCRQPREEGRTKVYDDRDSSLQCMQAESQNDRPPQYWKFPWTPDRHIAENPGGHATTRTPPTVTDRQQWLQWHGFPWAPYNPRDSHYHSDCRWTTLHTCHFWTAASIHKVSGQSTSTKLNYSIRLLKPKEGRMKDAAACRVHEFKSGMYDKAAQQEYLYGSDRLPECRELKKNHAPVTTAQTCWVLFVNYRECLQFFFLVPV